MKTILFLLAVVGASAQKSPPLDQQAWARAANGHARSADPTLFVPDGKGGVRAATPDEVAARGEELSRLTKVYYQAKELVEAGKRDDAIERLERLRAEADTVRTSALLAELYLMEERPLLARGLVASRMRSSDDRRLLLVGAALNAQSGTVAPGQLDYCRAVAGENIGADASDVRTALSQTTSPAALAYLALGGEWDGIGATRTAQALYERAWKADRGNPVVAWRLSKALMANRQPKEAAKVAEWGRARAKGALRSVLSSL